MARHDGNMPAGLPRPRGAVRLASLPNRPAVVERIMTQAIQPDRVKKHRARAQFTFFCGAEPEQVSGYEGQLEVAGRCLEWFVFDYVIGELQQTPAQHWLSVVGADLSVAERRAARACLNFTVSLFEITDLEAGRTIILDDLLRAPLNCIVTEPVLSTQVKVGQLLSGRVFPLPGGCALSGMAALMGRSATGEIKQLIADGRLNPQSVLAVISGLELENLCGRSVAEIETIDDPAVIHRRLQRYLEMRSGSVAIEQLWAQVENADHPFKVAAELARTLQIDDSDEMDVFFAHIVAAWSAAHAG